MIPYTLVRSRRRTLGIQITPRGEVVLRCPQGLSRRAAEGFLQQKEDWVLSHLAKLQARPQAPALTDGELEALKGAALPVFQARASQFAPLVGVDYGRVSVRAQRTLWGSCSRRGDLSFNCLLLLAPPEVLSYVVVHELCHRLEMNHGPRFWAAVERVLPDCRVQRAWLKDNGPGLTARLPQR